MKRVINVFKKSFRSIVPSRVLWTTIQKHRPLLSTLDPVRQNLMHSAHYHKARCSSANAKVQSRVTVFIRSSLTDSTQKSQFATPLMSTIALKDLQAYNASPIQVALTGGCLTRGFFVLTDWRYSDVSPSLIRSF